MVSKQNLGGFWANGEGFKWAWHAAEESNTGQCLSLLHQWLGSFLSINGWDPSVCKSNRLHVDILRFSFIKLARVYSINSSKIIGNFHAVLNFNRSFLKLNRFNCNSLPVLPDRCSCTSCFHANRWIGGFNSYLKMFTFIGLHVLKMLVICAYTKLKVRQCKNSDTERWSQYE